MNGKKLSKHNHEIEDTIKDAERALTVYLSEPGYSDYNNKHLINALRKLSLLMGILDLCPYATPKLYSDVIRDEINN